MVLAGACLAMAGGLAFHFSAGWKRPPIKGTAGDSRRAVASNNAVVVGGGSVLATNGGTETEAARLLKLAQQWQRAHPAYHVRIETTSPGWSSIAEVYRFTNQNGASISRVSTLITQPVQGRLVMQVEPARVVVFFPRLNQTMEFDHDQDVKKSMGVAGLTTDNPGGGLPRAKPRSCFVETGQGFKALTMMFAGPDLGLAEGSGAVFLTLKLDEAGRPFELEELTLGHRVTSKLSYLSFDQAVVSQDAPPVPSDARRATRPLQDVLEEELRPNRNKRSITI